MAEVNRSNIMLRCLLALLLSLGSSWAVAAPAAAASMSAMPKSISCADMGGAAMTFCQDCCAANVTEPTVIRTFAAIHLIDYQMIVTPESGKTLAPVPPPPRTRV